MKTLRIAISFLVLPLMAQAQPKVWWVKGENMIVDCVASSRQFPHLRAISLQGRTLTVEKQGEVFQWTTRMGQNSNSKVWDHKEVSLYVNLKPSFDGATHRGTLVFEGDEPVFVPLSCYPK